MEELIKRLERVIQTGAPDKDGMHPISAETVLEVVKGLSEHSTNLAEVGTDCISRQAAIDIFDDYNISVENGDLEAYCRDRKRLCELPPAQPKRGRWIPVDAFTAFGGDEATWMANGNPTAFHYCSVCKGQAYAGEDGESLLTDFCPNCGSDMRGEVHGMQ